MGAIMLKGKCVSKMSFNSNIAVLQSCLGPHISFYRLKKTSVFGQDLCNNHYNHFNIFLNENEFKDLKIIISSYIAIPIAISVQIITIRYFFKKGAARIRAPNEPI